MRVYSGSGLKLLSPFTNDVPDIAHRVHQERCLWAIYSLDFEGLNRCLESWEVENCDPIWMVRKAALLTEAIYATMNPGP